MKELAPLRLRFSHEELVVLLELSELPMTIGVGAEPFGDMPPHTVALLKQVGLRSLLARKSAEIKSDGQVVVDEQLAKLLFFCAYPQKILSIIWQENDRPTQVEFVYQVPDLTITHGQIYPGVHELIVFETDDDLLASRLLERLPCPDSISDEKSFTLPRQDFDRIQHHSSRTDLITQLSSVEVDEKTAASFAEAIQAGGARLLIKSSRQDREQISRENKTFLISPKSCWLLDGLADPACTSIMVVPLSSIAFKQQLLSLLR